MLTGVPVADRLRRVAAVCGLGWFLALAVGLLAPSLRGVSVLAAAAEVPTAVYIWLRVDGDASSAFGRLTGARILLQLAYALAYVVVPQSAAQSALFAAVLAVELGRRYLLIDLGRGDPALPRLTATCWAYVGLAVAEIPVLAAPHATGLNPVLVAFGVIAYVWLVGWVAVVSWRLLRENGPSIRRRIAKDGVGDEWLPEDDELLLEEVPPTS